MESVGARNFGAMAAVLLSCPCPVWRSKTGVATQPQSISSSSSSSAKQSVFNSNKRYRLCKVRSGGGSNSSRGMNDSCSSVAVKEGMFADEEDYIKAGGSELGFVQMQRKKAMSQQSKLADKVFFD